MSIGCVDVFPKGRDYVGRYSLIYPNNEFCLINKSACFCNGSNMLRAFSCSSIAELYSEEAT